MTCQVQQLSQCPQHLEAVGNWIFDEWWSRRHESAEVVLAWLRTHTPKDKVPYTCGQLLRDRERLCAPTAVLTMGSRSVCQTGDAPPWYRFSHAPGGRSCRQKG